MTTLSMELLPKSKNQPRFRKKSQILFVLLEFSMLQAGSSSFHFPGSQRELKASSCRAAADFRAEENPWSIHRAWRFWFVAVELHNIKRSGKWKLRLLFSPNCRLHNFIFSP